MGKSIGSGSPMGFGAIVRNFETAVNLSFVSGCDLTVF